MNVQGGLGSMGLGYLGHLVGGMGGSAGLPMGGMLSGGMQGAGLGGMIGSLFDNPKAGLYIGGGLGLLPKLLGMRM